MMSEKLGVWNLFQSDHALNLDIKVSRKLGADCGTRRRICCAKILGINRIHFMEILLAQVSEIDAAGDGIFQLCTRSLSDPADVFQHEAGLFGNAAPFDFSGRRIPRGHPGDEKQGACGGDGQRVGAERWWTVMNGAVGGLHRNGRKVKTFYQFGRDLGRPFELVSPLIFQQRRTCEE